MNREHIKEIVPFMQALAEGKTIQYRDKEYSTEWTDIRDEFGLSIFNDNGYEFRIKPEREYHGFDRIEQCENEMLKHEPFGFVKDINNGSIHSIASVEFGDFLTATIIMCGIPKEITLCSMIDNYTFMDGTPFGIAVEDGSHSNNDVLVDGKLTKIE